MFAFVGGHSKFAGRGASGRSVVEALERAVARAQARHRARRQFRETRAALLELDDRTLLDIVGLTRGQVGAMRGDAEDRRQLGLR